MHLHLPCAPISSICPHIVESSFCMKGLNNFLQSTKGAQDESLLYIPVIISVLWTLFVSLQHNAFYVFPLSEKFTIADLEYKQQLY